MIGSALYNLAIPEIYVYFAKYQGLTVKEMEELREAVVLEHQRKVQETMKAKAKST